MIFKIITILFFSAHGFSASQGANLREEYDRLKATASALAPDFLVGGYLKGKNYGDHVFLWHLAEEKGEAEMIRILRKKSQGEQSFDITFHHNEVIVRGRSVIRRFLGPVSTGWRNDTIDFESGEYLGSQGASNPKVDARDKEIMNSWGISHVE